MSINKRLLLLFFILFAFVSSFGQVFLKGSAYAFIPIYGEFYSSYSIASEIKLNKFGIEYQFKYTENFGGDPSTITKHQLGVKYYLKNTEGKSKIYVSPFINDRYYQSICDHTSLLSVPRTFIMKGNGYGLSIGYMKDLGKYFGFEAAPYFFYLDYYSGTKIYRDGNTEKYTPENRKFFGLKLFLYFKTT